MSWQKQNFNSQKMTVESNNSNNNAQKKLTRHTPKCCTVSATTTTSTTLEPVESKYHSAIKNFKVLKARKTKFFVYLVILLVAIVQTSYAIPTPTSGQRLILHTTQYREQRHQKLLQEQRSLVLPTPHRHHLHHRSVGNMPRTERSAGEDESQANGNDVGDYCRAFTQVEKQLQMARKQANITYIFVKEWLTKYTERQHKVSPQSFEQTWQRHNLSLQHPYKKILIRKFDIEPDQLHLDNKQNTYENFVEELKNMTKTWRSLEISLTKILAERIEKEKELLHNLNDDRQLYFEINQIFKDQINQIAQNIALTQNILAILNIDLDDEVSGVYSDIPHPEWFLTYEHLSVAKYFVALYDSLKAKCMK